MHKLGEVNTETTTLGRTGMQVTTAGLGTGGFSRAGIEKYGQAHAANIVRKAYDLGVRFFDTATAYGTEAAVGQGLEGFPRGSYVLSTKFPLFGEDWRVGVEKRFAETLDESLRALKTDYVDIYHLHGVPPEDYPNARDLLIPLLYKAREAGKIRHLGITERFMYDTAHKMLNAALEDDLFDVIMVGYNLMNPSAAETVFPRALRYGVGVLNMFAVRHALADRGQMVADIRKILSRGQGGLGLAAVEDALDFLTAADNGGPAARSIMDAAYRYCAHTIGVDVVLTGTGSEAHLRENLASLSSAALPGHILEKLEELFGNVDCVCGQEV